MKRMTAKGKSRSIAASAALILSLSVVGIARGEGEANLRETLLRGFDPLDNRVEDGVHVAHLPGRKRAVLTLDPGLQAHVAGVLERYEVPYAAVVAAEPTSGRILAYVSHSSADPNAGDLVRATNAPAASVFKIITGAALIDAEVSAGTRVCYGGGAGGIEAADLRDDEARDTRCATLSDAMGRSINSVFAKLADRHLSPRVLRRYGSAFAFGQNLPFDIRTPAGAIDIVDDRLEFARTAAGFWHTYLSPLHGLLVASTVANDGVMPRVSMIDRIEDRDGEVLYRHRPEAFRNVIPRATARRVAQMMENTVSRGTAHSAFFDDAGNAFVPGVDIAGKTGTLTAESPYRGYTWWVGFAPADEPTIAVAVLTVNSPQWRIKASYVAREALRYYLVERPRSLRNGG